MKVKHLIILVLLVLGMGAYIYYGIQKPAEERGADGDGDRLATGDFERLEHFDIQIGKTQIKIEKSGSGWRIIQPFNDLASEVKMTNLISALRKMKKTKVIADADKIKQGKDIAQYGLKEPKAKISFKTSDRTAPTTIVIGGQNPAFSGSYVQLNDAPDVYLATMDLDYLATQRPEDFREMRLTTVPSDEIVALEVKQKGQSMTFKKVDDQWTMTSPFQLPVDQEAVKGIVDKVALVRANSFVEKETPTKSPDIQVIVGFTEGTSDARTSPADARPSGVQIDFYQLPNPHFKAKGSKGLQTPAEDERYIYFAKSDKTPLAAVSRFHFENFEKKPETFVKKSFDDFLLSDIEKISIRKPAAMPVTLVKNGESFQVQQSKESKPANATNLEDALRQLRNLKALQFLDARKPESSKPASLGIDIELKGGGTLSYIFDLKKDVGELYRQNGGTWLRYLTSAEPLKTSAFEFGHLTAPEAEKKAEEKSEKKE